MYQRGDAVVVWVRFRHPTTNAYIDPTSVTLRVLKPDATVTQVTGGALTHPSVGHYSATVDIPNDDASGGTWKYRWEASGSYKGVNAGSFTVETLEFPN